MEKNARIYIAGRDTLIGSGIARHLVDQGYVGVFQDEEPELTNAHRVNAFFRRYQPEYVFYAAGKSGGIQSNRKYPADLMSDNLLSITHLVEASSRYSTRKLLYLSSSCAYPRDCPQPMRPEYLMTGLLEPTSAAYATAKLAGLALCRAYRQQYDFPAICAIPANVFGPGDDFSPEDSHVIAGMMRRMREAIRDGLPFVDLWGTGMPRREFLFVDDMASACLFLMNHYEAADTINIGSGCEYSTGQLARIIQDVSGYTGLVRFDASRPDGAPRKLLDSEPLRGMGWSAATPFRTAIEKTYAWYVGQTGVKAA